MNESSGYNYFVQKNAVSSAHAAVTACEKGNQVRILNDPVTVFGEPAFVIPLQNPGRVRRGGQTFVSVSQETCLTYEMSLRARLNIQQTG